MRRILMAGAALLLLAGCVSPGRTVARLNRHDPEYAKSDCRQVRKEAAEFSEETNGRRVVALAANLVVPFAGTAAAAAMTGIREDDRKALNRRVRTSCISDPLGGRVARR
jgi:hypothetical protein